MEVYIVAEGASPRRNCDRANTAGFAPRGYDKTSSLLT